jgi:hypothetical protein
MRWRPRLVLRFGRHGVASPTSGVGHLFSVLFEAVIALGATAALLASAASGWWMPIVLAAWLLLLARTVRDAWAWFAATDAERAAYRAEVAVHRPWTPPPGYAPIFDAHRCRRATGALVVAAVAGTVGHLGWHTDLLVPAMFATALLASGDLELRRRGALGARSQAA